MQNYTNEQTGKVYGELKEKKEGFFAKIFRNLFTGCLSCGCLFLIVCLLFIALFFYFISGDSGIKTGNPFTGQNSDSDFSEEFVTGSPDSSSRIAVIKVYGMITRDENASFSTCAVSGNIIRQLQLASADDSVKAVIIDLDTPGGEVTASDEIYKKILEVRKKKPVIAMMNTLCASGGYYIAAGCYPVIANKYTLTGSIGVIISTWNYKELFDKIGLKTEVYTSGKMKDMLNGGRERTAEETALVRTLVMNTYDGFVHVVASSRKIPADKIRNSPVGDGRIFDGKQALELKLVDTLGYFEDAVQAAVKEAKLKDFQVFRYEDKFDFGRFFNTLMAKSPAVFLPLSSSGTPGDVRIRKGVLYFLPAGY
ncbi:MAG: signal peptide peptidase SppA [Lentisphaeria bacterium]|nr:signal peptide peptidase SppA [Lentisphaeria bacterium]